MTNSPCINHEEAHEYFTIREFEDLVKTKGCHAIVTQMEPTTKMLLKSYFQHVTVPKEPIPILCKKC